MSQLLQNAVVDGVLEAVDGTSAPAYFDQGLPFDATGLAVTIADSVAHWHQGIPFSAAGRICVEQSQPIAYFGSGAAPFTANGKLAMDTSPAERYVGGVPFTTGGAVRVNGLAPFLGVTIVTQPQSLTVDEPDPAGFSVVATSGDASTILYQWQIGPVWVDIVDGGSFSGATTNTLLIDPTLIGQNGTTYRVKCSNAQPGETVSNSASLTVNSLASDLVLTFNGLDNVLTFDGASNVLTFTGTP